MTTHAFEPEAPSVQVASETAYARLRQDILLGALLPGARLKPGDLKERYGIGLTPIREALNRLNSEGLVVIEAHLGASVPILDKQKFHDLMDTRRQIERICLLKALENGDDVWEAGLISAMHLLSRTPPPSASDDTDAAMLWERRHRAFHWALIEPCGSDWLKQFWNLLCDHSERYRLARVLRHQGAGQSERDINAEHRAIMDSAIARDAEQTIRLMEDHLERTEKAVLWLMDETPNDTRRK